ncbi:MAG: SGNH/GDSL hydrolase family protein [Nocardioides sp.]|uniref:SGNH/GDSL hydrolase family protein n=1 Tax=Nocardioides sp. TaxID=35761 RepID=UPI003F00380E
MSHRIVALGDSHLDRLGARQQRLACARHAAGDPAAEAAVVNVAVGGSRTSELAEQVAAVDPAPGDLVVVSIGTNDAASWYPVPLDEAVSHLAATFAELARRGVGRVVLLTTPGVDRARLPQSNDGTEADLREHAAAYADLARAGGHEVVDAARVLADLGPDAFVDDGLHLSPSAYDRLLPVLAASLCGHPPA